MDFNLSAGAFTEEQNFQPFNADKTYDVIIIGGGPAGLTAAVYCMRKGVSTGIIVKHMGGQVAETSAVENYLGYKYINGIELVEKFREQVMQFSIAFDEGSEVQSIEDGQIKEIRMKDGRVFKTKTIIIASGKSWRKLNVPGEDRLVGKGVAYCATCDAPLFAGKKVIVVGGGNSAIESAVDLAKIAEHVTIIQFLENLTGDQVLIDKLAQFSNVSYNYEHEVISVNGNDGVESVTVKDRKTSEERTIKSDGIFVEIGLVPNNSFINNTVSVNKGGEIEVDYACRTSAQGIFAAGDVTTVPFKQIIIAGGEGAKAALAACEYIMKQ